MSQRFETTKWSVVLAARTGTSPESRAALSSLCQAYWFPLYAYVRSQGYGAEPASDLTQGYFLRLLEKNYLKDVRPAAGRFRSFLLASLKHFLSNERDRERALKRGGGRAAVSVDVETAEKLYRDEPMEEMTAETIFERRWALTVLDRTESRLQAEFDSTGKQRQFELLRGYLTGEAVQLPYREIAAELGMREGAVKVAVHRLRRRFGELLRREIADTVADEEQVDAELRHLLSVTAAYRA